MSGGGGGSADVCPEGHRFYSKPSSNTYERTRRVEGGRGVERGVGGGARGWGG